MNIKHRVPNLTNYRHVRCSLTTKCMSLSSQSEMRALSSYDLFTEFYQSIYVPGKIWDQKGSTYIRSYTKLSTVLCTYRTVNTIDIQAAGSYTITLLQWYTLVYAGRDTFWTFWYIYILLRWQLQLQYTYVCQSSICLVKNKYWTIKDFGRQIFESNMQVRTYTYVRSYTDYSPYPQHIIYTYIYYSMLNVLFFHCTYVRRYLTDILVS